MSLDERARNLREEIRQQAATIERPTAGAMARRSRRGRLATGLATIALLALVGAGLAIALGDDAARNDVTNDPEPSTTTIDEQAERTRAEGLPVDLLSAPGIPTPSGLDVQLYCLAEPTPTGSPCDDYHPYDPDEEQQWALEVSQAGRSALFEVRGTPIVREFDDDALLVQDGSSDAARFRLLRADGTAVPLQVVGESVPADPGPDVMLIDDLDVWRGMSIGPEDAHPRPYLVDGGAGTLRPLDVPAEVLWWAPNVDEVLWGSDGGCRVIWQQPDGTFDHHDLDCLDAEPGRYSYPQARPMEPDPALGEWREPGHLVLLESSDDGIPLVVHASRDRGATWHRVELEDRAWDGTTAQITAAVADALASVD